MKRAAVVVLVLGLGLGIWLWLSPRVRLPGDNPGRSRPGDSVPGAVVASVVSSADSPSLSTQRPPLLGETLLRDYAKPSLPPENDLTLMSHLMENFFLLVKSAADRPLGANEDWAAAFRGLNPTHEHFLPDQHAALNSQGQLVDRWGTPLFFHALGSRRFEIRSAGPDRKLWTADDIHRNTDGSFRHPEELNPPSLMETANRRTPREPAPR